MLQGGDNRPEPRTISPLFLHRFHGMSTRVTVYVCWRFQFDVGDGGVKEAIGPSL